MPGDVARLQRRHWAILAITAVTAAAAGAPGVGGVVLGGATMGVSLLLYATAFRILVEGQHRLLAVGLLFAKLAAFLGLGWWALSSGSERPDPLGFALGVTCCPAAIVWEAARGRKG